MPTTDAPVVESKTHLTDSEERVEPSTQEVSSSNDSSGDESHYDRHVLEQQLRELILKRAYSDATDFIEKHPKLDINFINDKSVSFLMTALSATTLNPTSAAVAFVETILSHPKFTLVAYRFPSGCTAFEMAIDTRNPSTVAVFLKHRALLNNNLVEDNEGNLQYTRAKALLEKSKNELEKKPKLAHVIQPKIDACTQVLAMVRDAAIRYAFKTDDATLLDRLSAAEVGFFVADLLNGEDFGDLMVMARKDPQKYPNIIQRSLDILSGKDFLKFFEKAEKTAETRQALTATEVARLNVQGRIDRQCHEVEKAFYQAARTVTNT